MHRNNMRRRIVAGLTSSVSGVALLCISGTAIAQTSVDPAAASVQDQAPSTDAPPADNRDIVVTGSRLITTGYSQPTPVTVAAVADLQLATPSSLPDALNKLPQFANSVGPRANAQLQGNSGEHGNILNLRGVGGNRVLILLDGTRVPPTTYRGAVDSNVIPQLLVQRVDVVTAGASAAYGSDAISGVVNHVIDDRLEGVRVLAQTGVSDRGDLFNYRLGIAGGLSFADGRGRFVASLERFRSEGITRLDRPYGGDGYAAVGANPSSTAAPGTAANPLIFVGGLKQLTNSIGGFIQTSTVPGLAPSIFLPGGGIRPAVRGAPTGTGSTFVGGDGYSVDVPNTLIAPLETNQGFAQVKFDFTDSLTAYVRGNYARSSTRYDTQADGIYGFNIYSGNAYLSPAVQARLGPNDNFVFWNFFTDQGPLISREETDAYMATGGLEGRIGSWRWQAEYTYGSSITNFSQRNFEVRKLAAALDAVRGPGGEIVCRVTLTNPTPFPGCVPLNAFGLGSESAASIDYIRGVSVYRAQNSTSDATLSLRGNLLSLPAGEVAIAVGAQYREQKLNLTSNSNPALPFDQTGLRGIPANRRTRFNSTNLGVAEGSLNVKEVFGEIAVPIFRDKPFFRELTLNGAARLTDYSTSGQATTWKLGAVWSPIQDLTFRATRSRDIRAPTLFDLYAGPQTNSIIATDPHTSVTQTIRQVTSGSPALEPEVGSTLSIGAVLRPSFLPGFSASIDYYKLNIKGAIATQSLVDILTECEISGGISPTCSLIDRPLPFSDRTAANNATEVRIVSQNLSFLETSGIDVDISYKRDLFGNALALRAYVNYVDKFLQQTNSIAPVFDYAGFGVNGATSYARPKFRATLSASYTMGDLTIFAQETFIGKIKFGPTQVYAAPPLKEVGYTDLTLTHKLPAGKNSSLFLTVTNLFDKLPPIAAAPSTPGLYYPSLFSLYDPGGRAYTFGIRASF